jgi:hypothetical protein
VRYKVALTIFGAAAFLFSIPLACALEQAYRARERGEAFLSNVRRLRVGQSTYDDVVAIETRYKSQSSFYGDRCDRDLCDVDSLFGNKWLYELGLVPGAMFTGGLRVRRGILTRISVSVDSNPRYNATTEEIPADPGVSPYEFHGRSYVESETYAFIWVRITTAASEEERQKAYAFNLACLTKLGGCKDANEILPMFKHPE